MSLRLRIVNGVAVERIHLLQITMPHFSSSHRDHRVYIRDVLLNETVENNK